MKDFAPATLLAIAEEVLGGFFWPVVVLLAVVTVLFVAALLRGARWRGPLWAGLIGGVLVAALAPLATQAGYGNLHGPLDWAALAVTSVAAFAGIGAAAFGLCGLLRGPRT